jgi:hypothetical protein
MEGFTIAGLRIAEINKEAVKQITKSFISEDALDYQQSIFRTFSHGPVMILWLKQANAVYKWINVVESVHGKSGFDIPLYNTGILASPDDRSSSNWAKCFFPEGPVLDLEYAFEDDEVFNLVCIEARRHTYSCTALALHCASSKF